MKRYVVVFIFDKGMNNVLLLKRNKPPYQNLLNGLGGKIEDNEEPIDAVLREIKEEANIGISSEDKWNFLFNIKFPFGVELNTFYIVKEETYLREVKSSLEGEIKWYNIEQDNLLVVQNPNLAGEGNIPYCLYLSKLIENKI